MDRYRVVAGVAKFGPQQKFTLSAAQIKVRRHNLEVPKDWDGNSDCVVKSTTALEFKAGEQIGLPELQRPHVDILAPLSEPKTDVEKTAVARQAAASVQDKPRARAK